MHQDRDVIDEALVTGMPRRELARRHRLSEAAVRRHHDAHVPETVARAYASGWETLRAETLLGRFDDLAHRTDLLLKKAERAADLRSAPGLVRDLRQTLETMARMTGELRDQAQMVVLADSSAFKAVAAAVLGVLEPHRSCGAGSPGRCARCHPSCRRGRPQRQRRRGDPRAPQPGGGAG